MYSNARTRSSIPGFSAAPAGEIATPGYSGIAPQGTFRQPAAALPGTAGGNNIPSTYTVPGAGSAEVPYQTIDVPATPADGKKLNATSPYTQLPDTAPAGYLPPSKQSQEAGGNPSDPMATPGRNVGPSPLNPDSGYWPEVPGEGQVERGLRQAHNEAQRNDQKYGTGYSPDYVDHPPPGGDPEWWKRMGYPNIGAAYGDAFQNMINPLKKFFGGLPNWLNPNRYRPPKPGDGPAPGQVPGKKYNVCFDSTGRHDCFLATGPASGSVRKEGDGKYTYIIRGAEGISEIPGFVIGEQPSVSVTPASGPPEPQPQGPPTPNRTADPPNNPQPFYPPELALAPPGEPAPAPNAPPSPNPSPAPNASPSPAPQPAVKPADNPDPSPFPNYPDLPSPDAPPTPQLNPPGSPSPSPSPPPAGSPSPGGGGLGAQSPTPNSSPQALQGKVPSATPNPDEQPHYDPSSKTAPEPKPDPLKQPPDNPPPTKTPDNCKDPCIQDLRDKQKEKKPVSISVKVFKSCDVEKQAPIFETKSISVPQDEADNYKLLYERIAQLEGLQCSPSNAIASVPEWWQIRAESQRPQLVVLFAEVLSTGKLTTSRWSLTIPHYARPKGFKPSIPSYEKGNWEGILVLTDNSKIIVNASSASECKRVINRLKILIPNNYRSVDGKAIKAKVGERTGTGLKKAKVIPIRADFYSSGAKSLTPDFTINLRKE